MAQMPRTVAVIQARMNSTRLPGKVLMPLAGAPLLQRLVERVRPARTLDALVVATTDTCADNPVAALCSKLAVSCYRGSETDVLGRMFAAAATERADILVRLTADNPFVDAAVIDLVVGQFNTVWPQADYAHNTGENGFPYGLYVEVAAVAALRAALQSDDPADREHVTWHIRSRPQQFRHCTVRAPRRFGNDSLSIDTVEDYLRLRTLFERHYAADPTFLYTALAEPELTGTV